MPAIGLVMFDLDGTLLRGATICETLARALGRSERMRVLERCREPADIRRARHEMAGWYAGLSMDELKSLLAKVCLAPGAAAGCEMLRRDGIVVGIASLTWSFAVERFATALGASQWMGVDLVSATEITHCWPEDKATFAMRTARNLPPTRRGIAAVGDSWGDIELLSAADLAIFVGPRLIDGLPPGVIHMPGADIRDVATLISRRDEGTDPSRML